MKWTHKVVCGETGLWWMATLRGDTLYHNGLHVDGEKPKERVEGFKTKAPSIEILYSQPGYKVTKLKVFKGNL